MLESIINPKRAEKGPWKMFFVGMIYASLSLLLVKWFFTKDAVLVQYSGMIVVTFSVMFSLPFMYYIIKREEREDEMIEGFWGVCKAHSDALMAFIWLFIGFVLAFSIGYAVLHDANLFNAQLATYCRINSPGNVDKCIETYSVEKVISTGNATKSDRFLSIIENNVYVMIFTLIFSLIFGAGAIFVLAWNASVIAAAVGVFTKYQIINIPLGIVRYMLHGIPEIAAYFVTALAGGIFGVGILRRKISNVRLFRVIENSVILLFIAIILLIFAGIIEVYIIPSIFS